jgi:hypothetical protein
MALEKAVSFCTRQRNCTCCSVAVLSPLRVGYARPILTGLIQPVGCAISADQSGEGHRPPWSDVGLLAGTVIVA